MRFKEARLSLPRFDLNLLKALDALLRERNVTAAARCVGVSQSAMSGMLARLREQLQDQLLVRVGGKLVPTERALTLEGDVRQLVRQLGRLFDPERDSCLATASRRLRIMASEHSVMLILPFVFRRASALAPGLSFDIVSIDSPAATVAADDVDLCLAGGPLTGLGNAASEVVRTRKILQDPFVAIADRAHPAPVERISIEEFRRYPNVSTQFPGVPRTVEEIVLAEEQRTTPPAIRVPGFIAMGPAVQGSDRIGIVPSQLAPMIAGMWGLRTMRLPDEVPPAVVRTLWHARNDADPIHCWLRSVVQESCAALIRAQPAPKTVREQRSC